MENNKNFKCKSCGANLKKEEKTCSYCDAVNENYKEQELNGEMGFENVFKEILEDVFEDVPFAPTSNTFNPFAGNGKR